MIFSLVRKKSYHIPEHVVQTYLVTLKKQIFNIFQGKVTSNLSKHLLFLIVIALP